MKIDVMIAFLLGLVIGLVLRRFVSMADPVSEAKPAPAASTLKAQFFSDCNYGGKMVELGPGKYANAAAMGAKNDDISSIKVPKGLSVTIYEDNDFKGAEKRLRANQGPVNIECLTSETMKGMKKWNDQVSSVIVEAL